MNAKGNSKAERFISITKDLILFLGGLAGIAYQQITGNVNTLLLVIFTAMVGIPGLTNLVTLLRGTTIALPSQSQVQPHSELESDNSS